MSKFTVKMESMPERCEVCHQTDMFDPSTGYCSRCSFIPIPMPDHPVGENRTQPFMTPQPFAPPQPFYQPPWGQPPSAQYPFAPPPIPQPFPYQPPVSPLAPVPPHVVHEPFNFQPAPPRQQRYYRYLGKATVSEWISFRNALVGGLGGVIPLLLTGWVFLLGNTPWIFFGFILEGLLASGFAGFQVGNHIRRTTAATPAREFRKTGIFSSGIATLPIMVVPYLGWFLFELKKSPNNPFTVGILVMLSILPFVFAIFILNILGGYLAARAVEIAERENLVPTYRA